MLLREAFHLWGTGALGARNDAGAMGMERFALRESKKCSVGRKRTGETTLATTRRPCSKIMPGVRSLHQLQKSLLTSSIERSKGLSTDKGCRLKCRAKGNVDDDDIFYDENGFDKKGFDKNGRNRLGRDKYGLDENGLDRFGIPGDAILDGPIIEPEYHTYIDPASGEPAPTYGHRNPLPNAAFWGDDLEEIQNSSPSFARAAKSARSFSAGGELREEDDDNDDDDPSDSETRPRTRRRAGGKRKNQKASSADAEEAQSDELSEEELANIAQLESLRDKFRAEEEGGEFKSMAQVIKDSEVEEKADKKGGKKGEGEFEEKEEEDVSLGKLFGHSGFGERGYALVSRDVATADSEVDKPLTNDQLWWNWQKPLEDEQPWSAWQKRAGDSDTVMAAAMAETGQIKLFGEKPTIAEATLARARKKVFYDERIAAEDARKEEIGALAYYKEWVKGYKKDTSKKAVQKHFEETGEEVGIQLLDMFSYQTDKEYRIMQGTDVRMRRDPLIMRMREDQIKQVWGGDPVYPTINYVQDPDSVADYRNENMHEPVQDILEMLQESGRLITQEEVRAIQEREKIEDDELGVFDGLSGAVDIGEEDEDEIDEDEDEIDSDKQAQSQMNLSKSTTASKKSSTAEEVIFDLDEVETVDDDEEKDGTLIKDEDEEKDGTLIIDEDIEKDGTLIIDEDDET